MDLFGDMAAILNSIRFQIAIAKKVHSVMRLSQTIALCVKTYENFAVFIQMENTTSRAH